MQEDPRHLRDMAKHWRMLAEVGDPQLRERREQWANALEHMADVNEQKSDQSSKENES